MKIFCVVCGKQAVNEFVKQNDKHCTTIIGAKAAIKSDECYCGHCAKDLDENGLFPEERISSSNYY
jgi:hypothetical protein